MPIYNNFLWFVLFPGDWATTSCSTSPIWPSPIWTNCNGCKSSIISDYYSLSFLLLQLVFFSSFLLAELLMLSTMTDTFVLSIGWAFVSIAASICFLYSKYIPSWCCCCCCCHSTKERGWERAPVYTQKNEDSFSLFVSISSWCVARSFVRSFFSADYFIIVRERLTRFAYQQTGHAAAPLTNQGPSFPSTNCP